MYETKFTSVGIDVGSSTTHLTFSELVVGRLASHFHRKPEVLRRQVIYRSPIMFTPFVSEGTIDHQAVLDFVEKSYREAGVAPDAVTSGAVICTGEAARRHNARAITETLAKDSGKFVCATAGHHFEALLAAHGSGSVELSRELKGTVVNLDIGGGTAKRTVISEGVVQDTAAINVGARLIAVGAGDIVARAEPAGLAIARSIGIDVAPGRRLSGEDRQRIADEMAELLVGFLGLADLSDLARRLLVTEAPLVLTSPFTLVCSGGVSEFIYERANSDPGDLGPMLGRAMRERLRRLLPAERLRAPQEGIRATVIGACQFTLQVSGETVYATDADELPVSNVPVLTVPLDWNNITAEGVAALTAKAFAADEEIAHCALYFGGPERFGYGKIRLLAEGIASALKQRSRQEQVVLIFAHNIARTLGQTLRRHMPQEAPFVCLDEIEVGNLDYLDIGVPPEGESYLPVVVKSLVFKPQPPV